MKRVCLNAERWEISIHAPCTGSDNCAPQAAEIGNNFNPRSLHGERQLIAAEWAEKISISIHAPCTGSDFAVSVYRFVCVISIHAPCTGSDNPSLPCIYL